jgi:NAD(P)-dependent dehydrogenase (short-subunit alcohol dehydrogenase family)
MVNQSSRTALVTGCSSGIAREIALRLHEAGLVVYATARRPDALSGLAASGIRVLALDVTDKASMVAAVETIAASRGQVDVLVNCAGFELWGTIEEVPAAEVRRQFDTNVFGLTQPVVPGMRARRYGRIVNISSVFGRFAVPGGAYYAASKHAVAAFSEALRRELAGFARVVLVEPTAARTRLNASTVWAGDDADGPYAQFHEDLARWHAQTYAGPPHNIAGRLAVSAADVARVITRAATSRRPRARYPVGVLARAMFLLRRWLPAAGFDAFVRTQSRSLIRKQAPARPVRKEPARELAASKPAGTQAHQVARAVPGGVHHQPR